MPDLIRFYTAEKLGTHQSLTPDGFLLCADVPIARIGTMLYADGEVPVTADRDGIIRIHRDEDEVFKPNAVYSFAGKPVTNDHPPEKVNPHNWRNYSVGVVLHPRRGDGLLTNNDYLYADLLIQDEDAIRDVREGKREVSAGYDAEYEELSPGEGRQHGIIGNHVALVDRGRCGYSCHIGDQEMAGQARRRGSVGDTILHSFVDRIMKARGTPSFDAVLVEELQRVATMLGDILSGATESGGFAKVDAPVENYGAEKDSPTSDRYSRDDMAGGGVHVHLHNAGAADAPEGDPAAGGAAPAGAGAVPGAEGGGDIESRVSALERAVAILAQGEESEDPQEAQQAEQQVGAPGGDPTDRPDQDRGVMRDAKARSRDVEGPTAPPVDEPIDASSKENVALDRRRAAVGDAASLRGPWQEMVSKAELLAPGIKYPTMDSKQGVTRTMDAMCKFRRRVLNEALQEDDTAAAVRQVASNGNIAQMSCDAVSAVFNGAAELVRQKRSHSATAHVGDGVNYNPGIGFSNDQTVQAQIRSWNTKNAEFWSKQSGH